MKTSIHISFTSISPVIAPEPDKPELADNTGDARAAKPTRQAPHHIARSRPAWAAKDDMVLQRKGKEAWTQDIKPSQEHLDDFLRSVYRHLTHRWTNDRLVAMDHVGTALYSDMRRAELQTIEGAGYLAQQYGLSIAKLFTPEENQAGLRITNKHTPQYQRTRPDKEFFDQCQSIYQASGHSHPPDRIQFVNSMNVAHRIQEILCRGDANFISLEESSPITGIKHLEHGLVAIEFKTSEAADIAGTLLKRLGGRPSMFEVMKRAHPVPRLATTLDQQLDNAATLASLLRADEQGPVAALAKLPEGHAMQAMAACAASLLTGLWKALERQAATPEFKHDPLIANALNALANVANALPALTSDSPRFFAGYAAMLEELNLLLVATKPYGKDDFKTAALTMLKARAGKALDHLHIADPELYLSTSGMGAVLSMGLDAAGVLNGSTHFTTLTGQAQEPVYFEVPGFLNEVPSRFLDHLKLHQYHGEGMDGKKVLMAWLNGSAPERKGISDKINNWDAQKLVQKMLEWLETSRTSTDRPTVLVLDATIETPGPDGTSDLAVVLDGLKDPVNNGSLKILLCKSYQKYTTGSGKIMAGAVTMIARDDAKTQDAAMQLKNAEEDIGWMQNDESQLLTHFLTHAHASELVMIGNAAKNAAFIDKVCLRIRPDAAHRSLIRREDATPFIMANLREVGVRAKNGVDILPVSVDQLMTRQAIKRDGFGYPPTVAVQFENKQWRITAGQETQEEIIEKFYGFGWLEDGNVETLTPAAALSQANRIAAEATQVIYDTVDVCTWAEAALHVLRERTRQGSEVHAAALHECEALFDKITVEQMTGDNAQQKFQMKDELRQKLKTELMKFDAQAESMLAGQLRIIGSAFAPRLPDSIRAGTDVEVMRAAIKRAPDGFREGNAADLPIGSLHVSLTPNMVASLLKLLGAALGPQNVSDIDRPELEAFYRGALAAGLPRVSPSTRSHIVLDWSRLQVQTLACATGKEAQQTAVDGLLRHVHLAPYREDKAKILASIPESTFAALAPSLQRKLVDALFGPLDACSRIEFIKTLSENGNPGKAGACLAKFNAELNDSHAGSAENAPF